MARKMTGKLIAEYEGLKIYIKDMKPKKSGKRRIWISIRQDKPKCWKVVASLSYVNAVDIRFEK